MQNIPEALRYAAEAATDAGLPLCEQCDGDGCRACAASRHRSGDTNHDCACIGIGSDIAAVSHYLLGVDEDWATEALEIIADAHQANDDGDCEECDDRWPCIPADIYLGVAEDVYGPEGGQHVPYNEGDCETCEKHQRA